MKSLTIQLLQRAIQDIEERYRDQLETKVRYERFMDGETLEEWKFFLGSDVIWLTHPHVVADIVEQFLEFPESKILQLTQEERLLLQTAALVHDWGELILDGEGVGDISFDQQEAYHQKKELEIFSRVVESVSSPDERNFIIHAYKEVVFDKTTRLGKLFYAIERIGYLETAITAYQGKNGKLIHNWKGLVGNVLSNQVSALVALSKEYPYIHHLLTLHSHMISKMFQEIDSEKIPKDKFDGASFVREKLESERAKWKESAFTLVAPS